MYKVDWLWRPKGVTPLHHQKIELQHIVYNISIS
jgi:hypothetical protein